MNRDGYTLLDRIEFASHRLLRLLPTELVSTIGAFLAAIESRRTYWLGRPWTRAVCRNIAQLTGETDPKVLRDYVFRSSENTGRLRAEYSILNRLTNSDRIVFEGTENIKDTDQPIIFFMAHVSNWEVVYPAMSTQGIAISMLYDPPEERARRHIVEDVRLSFTQVDPDHNIISARSNTMRQCVNTLEAGKNLLIFVDEERDGLVWSPHLGRTLPNQGNRLFVARLARRFQAKIIPVRISRIAGVKFLCEYMPALSQPSTGDADADTLALADTIARHVEEWIRADLAQWFWLPDLDLDRKFPKRRKAWRKRE